MYIIFDREITKYTVIYDAYMRLWLTLFIYEQESWAFGKQSIHTACTHAQPSSYMQVQQTYEDALAQDPSVFDYDGV
jgi:hypothetical protein